MTESSWLDGLRAKVAEANANTTSITSTLLRERHQIGLQLEVSLRKLGALADAREHGTQELHTRVLDAFKRRQFEALSPRERRYAAKQFVHASPLEMQAFLAAHPSVWHIFASECFRQYEQLASTSEFSAYQRLISLAPNAIGFLHQLGRPQDIVGPHGPSIVARSLSGADLSGAREQIHKQGFDSSWAYSAISLAAWTRLRSDGGATFAELWEPLAQDPIAEAMLLPRQNNKKSWFGTIERPARVRGAMAASAMYISALVRSASAKPKAATNWGRFAEGLLSSEFKDPRIPPESRGWQKLKEFDEGAYRGFLEHLISEDLQLFFEHAMDDKRRKLFWLKYLGSIRRTVCVLAPGTHTRLRQTFEGAEKRLAAAMSRAKRFTSGDVSAFCLYFDRFVIVEFSTSGNAGQIYDRGVFEQNLEQIVAGRGAKSASDLKSERLRRERILHHAHSWEQDTARELAKLAINMDGARVG